MREETRKLLAWQAILDEIEDLKLDDVQRRQLSESAQKARRDLKEAIWRSYKNVLLLAKDGSLMNKDLGLVHSSSSEGGPISNVLHRLKEDGDVEKGVSPQFLARNWPPAIAEWSTKGVRDVFFASPKFPRLLNAESVKDTICRGVEEGLFAYVGKAAHGVYEPFLYKCSLTPVVVELVDDVYLIPKPAAEAHLKNLVSPTPTPYPTPSPSPGPTPSPPPGPEPKPAESATGFSWSGEIPPQKWVNFYMKVLSKFATGGGLRLTVHVSAKPDDGVNKSKLAETRAALRELGLSDDVKPD